MSGVYKLLIIFILFVPQIAFTLDAKLVISGDQNINDKWYRTLSANIPKIKTLNRVVKKQYFQILLLFKEYKTDNEKIVNIKYDLNVEKPNGGKYLEQKGLEAINQKIDDSDLVQLCNEKLKVCFESEDKPGIYKIHVTVYDLNSNEIVTEQGQIELIEFENQRYFEDDESFSDWLTYYYSKPSPEKAIDAYLYYSKSKINEHETAFVPIFSFFLEVFNNNNFLIPHLVDLYNAQNLKTRIYIIYLLRYLDYDSSDFFNTLKGNDKKVYENILTERFPLPDDEITNAAHLDLQWGRFFASGKIKPIRRIISALDFYQYRDSAENSKNSKKTEIDLKNAYKGAIFDAALWSLESNCKQHPLVGQYCEYILANDNLTDSVKAWLGLVLSKAYPDKFQMMHQGPGSWTLKSLE